LGGDPASGTTLGKIYRVWMDVKSGLSRSEQKSVLEKRCEYGEDAAQRLMKKPWLRIMICPLT
jgi:hypothetical protein